MSSDCPGVFRPAAEMICSPGLTIYREVFIIKKLNSKRFACLGKTYVLLLKTWKSVSAWSFLSQAVSSQRYLLLNFRLFYFCCCCFSFWLAVVSVSFICMFLTRSRYSKHNDNYYKRYSSREGYATFVE